MDIRIRYRVIYGVALGLAILADPATNFAQNQGKNAPASPAQQPSNSTAAPKKTPEELADDLTAEFKRLSGSWRPESAVLAGDKIPDEICAGIQLELTDNKFKTLTNGIETSGKISLDLSTDPRSMDISIEAGPDAGKTIKCIYKFEDDHLQVAYSLAFDEVRPTEFESNQDNKLLLIVYRPAEKDAEQNPAPTKAADPK